MLILLEILESTTQDQRTQRISVGIQKIIKVMTNEAFPGSFVRGSTLIETAHPARHHSNHLHELFFDRRSS